MATSPPNRGERGIALITTSMVLVPLMVFAAFGVDLASWYARITDLQRAADAAALAGAVWMPNLTRATDEAEDSLASNGIVHGQDSMAVVIERGATPTALRVTVIDNDAERYFSQIVASGPQSLRRHAEAEYNLPLPLGSPLNYFGGDAGRTQPTMTASGQPAVPAATSPNPPPDYTTRLPTNGNCRVAEGGTGPTVLGRWVSGVFSTATGGSTPACVWNVLTTSPSSLHPSYTTVAPTSAQPCRVGYETSLGWWTGGAHSTSSVPNGISSGSGNRLCSFPSVTTPNPINATRSPGFWAAIEGPQTNAFQGDIYSTRCYGGGPGCGSVQNQQFQTGSNRGFWYVMRIPAGLTGSVALNVFDASYVQGPTEQRAGDRGLDGSSAVFPTRFHVYRQNHPLDSNDRTALFSGAPGTSEGSCNWEVTNQAAFSGQWRNLCTIGAVSPGQTYLLNVQTVGTSGAGVNGYALEAVANGSHSGVQPSLYASASMAMQNNNFCPTPGCTPAPATFYLAEVAPQYAGKVLVMELWDSGDVGGSTTASMAPMRPSLSSPRPVVPVDASECTWTADPAPNASLSGITSPVRGTPQPSDDPTTCVVDTSLGSSGGQQFQGSWLRIRIQIPPSYTCTVGLNPETTAGSCWWGIQYTFSGSANDVTTWQARIEGNPLQLTE